MNTQFLKLVLLVGFAVSSPLDLFGQVTVSGIEDRATGWRRVNSKEHRFEALFPTQVTLTRSSSTDQIGTYPIAVFLSDAPTGVFMILSQGMSARLNALSKESSAQGNGLLFQRIFDEAEKVVFDDIPEFVTAEKVGDVSFAGNPARLYNMVAMGKKIGEAILARNGSDLIVLMAVDLGERSESNVSLFFSSVRFL
jgi:hypothetical protein